MLSGSPSRRCAVLGQPIAHSLSPVLHRAGYESVGLTWTYDPHEVGEGELRGFLDGLGDEWRGLSLTMPLKREALSLMDEVSSGVELSGAVNTVVLEAGSRRGLNTDIPGAVAAVRERTDRSLARGVILGGGATATSTGLALCDLGVREIELVVRDAARADETVRALEARGALDRLDVTLLSQADPFEADIVVSTIPAQAQDEALVERCSAVPVVFDVIYHPWPTPLALSAEREGRVLVGGLDLLVHQAVLQFGEFTGSPGPLDVMRAAGEAALAGRGEA